MKFGRKLKELRIPVWSSYYIDYQELKYMLKSHLERTVDDSDEEEFVAGDAKSRHGSAEYRGAVREREMEGHAAEMKVKVRTSGIKKYGKNQPRRDIRKMSEDFFTMLEDEINLVEGFYKVTLDSLQQQLNQARLVYYNQEDFTGQLQAAKTKAMSAAAHHINHDINMLVSFVELNKVAVRKITKKYAKITQQPLKKLVLDEVANKRSFMKAEKLAHLRGTRCTNIHTYIHTYKLTYIHTT